MNHARAVDASELGRRARVLVVEDERIVAKDLQHTLGAFGYDVPQTASSADEALRLAARTPPDLVLMDIRIEGQTDGIEAAAQLRRQLGVPVVFLTAYADVATVERAKVAEPLGYLVKPVKAEELRSTVEIALHEHAARTRLAAHERWLTTVLSSIADAVISTDADARVDAINPAGERMTGWRADEAIGRPVREVVGLRASRDGAPLAPVETALRERRVVRTDDARLEGAGTPVHVADSAAPVLDEDGAVQGAVLVLHDITEQQLLRRRLELHERMAALGTLAAGVAHEINNPLAWMLFSVELARKNLEGAGGALPDAAHVAKVVSALADVRAGADRIREIVADLRRFTGPPALEPRAIDITTALGWALEVTRGVVERRARLVVHVDDALPPVRGDETRLGQVFINLLINAAHAISSGPPSENQVSVEARRAPDGRVSIDVGDTGEGMSEEVQRRIFEPFFTTKPTGEGSGLGLALARDIVTALGGELSVESRVGVGSVFRVLLPAADVEVAAPADAPPPVERSAKATGAILIVEDERRLRAVLRRHLAAAGHLITEAGGVDEALALLDAGQRFDLILSDLMMPGATGMDLHRTLLARHPEQARRMVFMTGGGALEGVQEFLAGAARPWLEKPFTPARLEELVQRQLRELGAAPR